MKLSEAKKGCALIITDIGLNENLELGLRLMHLGFLVNEEITVLNKTPLTSDVVLLKIRGTQMALTKDESNLIRVRE